MPCGNSSEEARAKDCIFDLTVAAWIPYDCYDEEISKEFMALGPWDFYESNSTEWDLRDAPASQRVLLPDVDAISDSSENMWTNRRYHIVHCLYAWKMKDRAVIRGSGQKEHLCLIIIRNIVRWRCEIRRYQWTRGLRFRFLLVRWNLSEVFCTHYVPGWSKFAKILNPCVIVKGMFSAKIIRSHVVPAFVWKSEDYLLCSLFLDTLVEHPH